MTDIQTLYESLYQSCRRKYSFNANSQESLKSWQLAFRPALRDALGLSRMDSDLLGFEPRVELISQVVMDGYLRESWQIEVEPGFFLPFFLLRPQTGNGLRPLVLCPHGHNPPHIYAGIYLDEAEHKSILDGERDIAVQAVLEGYMVIAPTTRGFGETRTQADRTAQNLSSCRTQLLHGLMLGRTPVGERVWDIERLLDWSFKNLEIDLRRIAITGNSGGRTISLFAAACDERIRVAVPSSYFCTFSGSIGTIYHCDCNYVPGILRMGEMWDVAGLIAPRPFCAIAGLEDEIFPIREVRKAFESLKYIYTVAGVPENCQLYIGNGGHRFYKDGAWAFVREQFGKVSC